MSKRADASAGAHYKKEIRQSVLMVGSRVFIADSSHPWTAHAGELIAYEKYGLGWMGWRIKLDGNCGECYANSSQLRMAS